MEEELTAQRDAALAVTRALQAQWAEQREELEQKLERRALTAERLRLHAEEALRRSETERQWEKRRCGRLLSMSLLFGLLGAVIGWVFGLVVAVGFHQVGIGFLVVLPTMVIGGIVGLATAKTTIRLETRRRQRTQRQQVSRHAEVEMAVQRAVDGTDLPLEPLTGLAGEEVEESRQRRRSSSPSEENKTPVPPRESWWGFGWSVLSTSVRTTRDLMSGALRASGFVNEAISNDRKEL